jgi:hypothetical protein
MTLDATLLLIKDIVPVIKGEARLNDSALLVSRSPTYSRARARGIYLAFEHGRVGVITVSSRQQLQSLLLTVI